MIRMYNIYTCVHKENVLDVFLIRFTIIIH